ncbi:hypothetical protein FJT64_005712 [Amphibalanus amphitrite]|uniref:Uncharacterized protein n=1 Tax=Amphibalanus amphitrite TaxID=1232801 RepID=A0A6A4VRK3_AMPAM|nr:hypothetical protein FJT64_005712 [Amphibalanus amphitrite]
MRPLALVLVGALLCAALAQDDAPLRGRGRTRARLISRERLADVIDGAVSIEDSGEDGRKRILVRRPGSARRRVKVIRRPRPEPSTTAAPATEAPTTEPPVTTFAPRTFPSFAATSAPARFSPEPEPTLPEPVFLQRPAEPEPEVRQRLVSARRPAAPSVAAPTSAPRRQRPAEPVSSSGGRQLNRKEEVVGTIRNYSYYNEDGSFTFGYEAEDGSFKEETRGTDCVVRGKYGYIDPEGVKREFTYESGNPCDETATEEALFDEQGFPILEEDGSLAGGVDPLDDQPIRIPTNTQFISQTKEERLPEEELRQFRQPVRSRRPEPSRRRTTPAPAPAPQPTEAQFERPEPVTFRPRPTFSFQQESQEEPQRPAPRPPVTFRPTIRVEPERRPEPTQPTFVTPQPRPFTPQPRPFTPQPRPFSPQPPRPAISGVFNFDEALSEIQSRPTTAPAPRPLDEGDEDFALGRPKAAVSGNFDHQLVFDPTTGKHRTDLVQTLPEGTEIRIGENINSFGTGPTTTTTPRPFQNNVFANLPTRPPTPRPTPPPTTRPPPPPPTTRPPPPRPSLASFSPPQPSSRPPFTAFNQPPQPFRPPQQFGQPQQFRPPQPQQTRQPFSVFNNRPQPPQQQQQQRPVFSVFNQPRPQPGQPGQPQPRPIFLGPQPSPQPQPQQQESDSSPSSSGARPVQQVSFGTQVANPVFSRFGVPQPFGQFSGAPAPPQQQGQFRPPAPINFFGQGQG